MSRLAVGWAAAAATLALGCASTYAGDDRAATSASDEVRRRVVELQRKVTVHEIEIERLRRQLAELEARLAGGGAAAARPPQELPAPEPAPAPPEGEVEEIEGSDLELVPPLSPPVATPPDLAPSPPPAAGEGAPAPPVDEAGQSLYDRGYTLYHQGSYIDAESSFQRFLQGYADTDLADNAQYWIGEARFARRDFEGALAAFREVVTRYPEGNKVADALLKVGDSLAALDDVEGAREVYAEVERRFPATAAAVMAEERRAALP